MASAAAPHLEPLHKTLADLLNLLYGIGTAQNDENLDRNLIKRLMNQLLEGCDRKAQELEQQSDCYRFEEEWAALAWGLLTVVCKLRERPADVEESQLEERLNLQLVWLVNHWRNPVPFDAAEHELDFQWHRFYQFLTSALQALHALYSRGESPHPSHDIAQFRNNELTACVGSFKQLCTAYSKSLSLQLRCAQVERISAFAPIPTELVQRKADFYSKVLYCLGILCARLQGFRYWSFNGPDPVKPLIDSVVIVVEQLLNDCLFCCEPYSSAILVTNNLFSFQSGCLARGAIFSQFEVQIISEETATAIQCEVNTAVASGRAPSAALSVRHPSAALLAMKPTTGTKRNNATANAEGGNTAHKKSDVNSRECVVLNASYSEKHSTWQATYPHLLCTTRQKDSALLDARSNQIGKRPLFYFFIKGTMFSPRGQLAACYTLSLPFTIATRRNQDCQVQRMMSSYTATCFWLYGTSSIDGLILSWAEAGITWERFKQLYKAHFRFNAEVSRDLSDADFDLLEQKMCCEDCRQVEDTETGQRMVTFKNVMCPHLRYDTADSAACKFSIWRGILEILQLFQDAKTNAKTLWDDNYLLGFMDNDRVCSLLLRRPQPCLCLSLSYVVGGSVCVVVKPASGELIHLEPLDLKRLQGKSLNEYLADIAAAEQVEYLIDANEQLVPVVDIVRKYRIGADNCLVKEIASNVTHAGGVERIHTMRFTPVRVAVVTCRDGADKDRLSPEAGPSALEMGTHRPHVHFPRNGNIAYAAQPLPLTPVTPTTTCSSELPIGHHGDFVSQLQRLMKAHNKDPAEVSSLLQYLAFAPPSADPFHMPMPMGVPGVPALYHDQMGMH